jgi:uncharacterized SAM-binding protein YcdF (DUF218 family)
MPLPVLYILLITGLLLMWRNRSKARKIVLIIAGLWFLVISTLPVPRALVKSLEGRYHQLTDTEIKALPDSCDIIVLGGGHTDDKELTPNNQLSPQALVRLVEGIRIHRMIPGSRIILSGYSGKTIEPQAIVLYKTAKLLGVDTSSMAFQTRPANTLREAEEYIKNFGRSRTLIVVTSDIHMPRAMMHFRNVGLDPIPAPANELIKYGSRKYIWRWIPSSGNIQMMEEAMHEYAGILWEKMGGK